MLELIPAYGYANARVKAMKGKLLSHDDLRKLLAVDSIDEELELLEETAYKPELVELSTRFKGIELINRALNLNLVNIVKKISKFMPGNGKQAELLKLITQEWDVQNLKLLIALKATGVHPQLDQFVFFSENSEERYIQLLAPEVTLKKAVHRLSLRGDNIGKAFQTIEKELIEKTKNESEIDFREMYRYIDEAHYSTLLETAASADEPVKKLVNAKLQFIDAMAVLKMLAAGVDQKQIAEGIIAPRSRAGRYAAELSKSESALAAVKKVVEIHGLPPELVSEFEAKPRSLVALEVALERMLMQKALKTVKVSVLSFAVILGFVYLKNEEVTVLKSIAYSTQAGVRDEVKKLIPV